MLRNLLHRMCHLCDFTSYTDIKRLNKRLILQYLAFYQNKCQLLFKKRLLVDISLGNIQLVRYYELFTFCYIYKGLRTNSCVLVR